MTLDHLSNGRFLMGIGASGPQVVEGWHGVAYGKPMKRTREYIEIVRAIWAREKPLEYDGEHYQIPYRGPGATDQAALSALPLDQLRERRERTQAVDVASEQPAEQWSP